MGNFESTPKPIIKSTTINDDLHDKDDNLIIESTTKVDDDLLDTDYDLYAKDDDLLEKAETLRHQAHTLRSLAKHLSERSQNEYHFGCRLEAKQLSNEKKRLYNEMDEKNCEAAKLIFQHYNQHIQADNIIDLHGLYVHEAFEYLQKKIYQCRSTNILRLTVITGAGNNSPQQIAKIKPEVREFAERNRIAVKSFTGHLVLDLAEEKRNKKRVEAPMPSVDTTCIIL